MLCKENVLLKTYFYMMKCIFTLWTKIYKSRTIDLRCTPTYSRKKIGLGTDSLFAVRYRPAEAEQTSPVGSPCLCKRHSILRFLLSWQSVGLHWWSVVLDEVQLAAGQSVEDRGALVFIPVDVSTRSRPRLCVSAALMYYRSLPFVISGST